jgi:hypothetical protein
MPKIRVFSETGPAVVPSWPADIRRGRRGLSPAPFVRATALPVDSGAYILPRGARPLRYLFAKRLHGRQTRR